MKQAILKNMHRIVAVVLLLAGIATLFMCFGLEIGGTKIIKSVRFGKFTRPDAGFVPTVFGVMLTIFAALNVIREFFKPGSVPKDLENVNWLKWAAFLAICVIYVAMIKKIGFIVDTCICLFAMIKISDKRWVKPLIIAVVFTAICFVVFRYAMNIRLPGASWF